MIAGSFYSCDSKDETHPEKEIAEWFSNVKVKNASEFNDLVEVKLMGFDRNLDQYVELASGDWEDGSFTIIPPETLASNYLHMLINNNGLPTTILYPPSTVTLSNQNVNVGNVQFWGFDKDGNLVTIFYPTKIVEGCNIEAVFTYVDSDVNITGYKESDTYITERNRDINADIWYLWKHKTIYSINWKKGLNIWYLSSHYSLTKRTLTEQWSSAPIGGLEWNGSEENLHYIIKNQTK